MGFVDQTQSAELALHRVIRRKQCQAEWVEPLHIFISAEQLSSNSRMIQRDSSIRPAFLQLEIESSTIKVFGCES